MNLIKNFFQYQRFVQSYIPNYTASMKPLIICLIFSFLLVSTANISAQEVKTTTPAAQSTPHTAKKATKSKKPKGLFKDDFDGDVGIKYIGTEPLPYEEIGKIKESSRSDEPAKAKKAVKSTSKSTAKPVGQPTSEVGTATTEAASMTEQPVKAVPETVTTKASDVKMTSKFVKAAAKSVEKTAKTDAEIGAPKAAEVKKTPKAVKVATKSVEKPAVSDEVGKMKEVKTEMTSTKTEAKSAAMEVKTTPKVEVVKAEMPAPVVRSGSKTAQKPTNKPSARGAHIEFEKMTIDLGNVKEDAIVERYFDFKNTGTSTLEILDCRGSCGCIQPRAMATIIEPGESGQIYVKYIARNKVGPQRPVVTLTTNSSPSVIRLFVETWVDQIPGGVKDPTPQTKSENN